MKRRGALVLAIVLAFAVLAGFALAGQTRAVGPASVLAILAGRVELAHGAAPYAPASDGETVAAGDRLRTDAAGHAVVTFFDGSTLDIAPATEVTVVAAASHDGAVDLVIAQAIGRTFSSVQKLVDPRSRYEIHTPSITAVVRGTKFEIEVAADGSAIERTTEGLVAVSSAGTEVLVPAGMETRAAPAAPPAAPAPMPTQRTTSTPPTATPPPTQAPAGVSGPASSPLPEVFIAVPVTAGPTAPSLVPSIVTGPVPATAAPVLSTLAPLPTTGSTGLPAVTVVPLPTATVVPLPSATVAPLPTVSAPPVTSPLPALSPTSPALPITTIP